LAGKTHNLSIKHWCLYQCTEAFKVLAYEINASLGHVYNTMVCNILYSAFANAYVHDNHKLTSWGQGSEVNSAVKNVTEFDMKLGMKKLISYVMQLF